MAIGKKITEDYLGTIYQIWESKKFCIDGVRCAEVARLLNVSKPSVYEVIEKLKENKLVRKKQRSAIFLSKKGMEKAKEIIHTKRVLEVFLVDFLGRNPSKIQEDVHSMEHTFSLETLRRLDRKLGNPKICPHGNRTGKKFMFS